MVHALCHVLVLAVVVRCVTLLCSDGPLLDSREREHLQRAVDHVTSVAIDHKNLLAIVCRDMPPEALREEDGVGINLDRERMFTPLWAPNDDLPCIDKEEGVACGAIDGSDDGRASELDGLLAANGCCAISRQKHVIIAIKDACALGLLRGHKTSLIADGAEHRKAEQGWRSLCRKSVAAGTQRFATPRLVLIVRMGTRNAALLALCPARGLLVALNIHSQAALGLSTTLIDPATFLESPRRDLATLGWRCRRLQTCLLARPARGHAGVQSLALTEEVILLVALLPRNLAAVRLDTALPAGGALVLHPILRTRSALSQLLASPWCAVHVGDVRTSRHALSLASGKRSIFHEALKAWICATVRMSAILTWLATGRLACGPASQLLAAPWLAVPMLRVRRASYA
mmetsp:Transcript_46434/g.122668  ORF Transcript_46434/g.122668 Transcript_46434/m.122668 type:complete len:402 (+) Transcript_46434:588-1793(+)